MSGLIQKAKDAMHGDKHHSTTTSTNAGPHDTNVANKADPRVDSDMDHRNNPTSTMGSSGSGMGTATAGTTHGSTNAGPHNSNLMNKMDPRVDSDMDNRGNPTSGVTGFDGTHSGSTSHGVHAGTTNHGISAGTTNHGTTGSTNAGPHNSNLMNKADPRIDSDRDHRANPASGVGSGTYAGTTGSSATGIHSSATPGSGNARDTAGPHNSNILNKVDPRVDSDMDGSKTYGGNATAK